MKLGRFDEAKSWSTQGILQERDWQKSLGYNVLCATAGARITREAFEACSSALRHGQGTGQDLRWMHPTQRFNDGHSDLTPWKSILDWPFSTVTGRRCQHGLT